VHTFDQYTLPGLRVDAAQGEGQETVQMFDVEDDVDVPPGTAIRKCTGSRTFWLVPLAMRICPGCGEPFASPESLRRTSERRGAIIQRCVSCSVQPSDFMKAITPEALFFAIDVSIARCRSSDGVPCPGPFEGHALELTHPRPVELKPSALAIEQDEEPSWPEARFFTGNDVY
jgi:hypothetical protein